MASEKKTEENKGTKIRGIYMRDQKSILKQMLLLLQIQIISVLLVIVFSAGFSLNSSEERIRTAGKNLLDIYSGQMEERLVQAWQNLSAVVYDNYDLDLLESAGETERYHAAERLETSLKNIIKTNKSAQMLVIADAVYGICLDANDGQFSFKEKNDLRAFALENAQNRTGGNGWQFYITDDKAYLYRLLQTGRRVSMVFISAESLMADIKEDASERMGFLLIDRDGRIYAKAGYEIPGMTDKEMISQIDQKRYYAAFTAIGDKNIGIMNLQSRTEVLRQLRGGLLLIGAAVLLLIFDYYIYRLLKRKLVVPMQRATDIMEEISEGNTELRLPDEGEALEFRTLSDTFNHLMDEVVSLKIESYEKQLALSDAEEKYIRLQIRPHFFLNAMTTIASLSATGRTDEINTYIDALSLNIRYMFSTGLHTVPLREEIRHVENYFRMQELKYPDAVFYYVDMPEELGDWPIPQMLIHTLVENEYKYAIPPEGTLTLFIRIYTEQDDMLIIELEDDGKGYPEEVIDAVNNGQDTSSADGTRIGLYSIRRLLELMYEQENLFEIKNAFPHGAISRLRISASPVHQKNKG